MTPSFIWFDLGYTLVYRQRETVYQRFLEEEGIRISLEQLEKAYHLADKTFMRDYPGALGKEWNTFFPWYLGVLNFRLGLRFDLQRQAKRMQEIAVTAPDEWAAFPFAVTVLETLRRRNIGTGLISNWDRSARDVLEAAGLAGHLDTVVISSEIGLEKPGREIFLYAVRQAGVSPQDCWHVGDNYYDDVVGSLRAGMQPVLINRFGREGIEELEFDPVIPSVEAIPQLLTKQQKRRSV